MAMARSALASRRQLSARSAPLTRLAAASAASLAPTAPSAPPASDAQLAALVSLCVDARRLLVLTGAGCSTESGVPDYRSPSGAYSTGFKPMTHQAFLASAANRARYWERSFAGWPRFSGTAPNAAHTALAELEQRGWVSGVVTQNVDRLHSAAGSRGVLELHGTTHEVVCLGCGQRTPRQRVQQQLAELNPAAAAQLAAAAARPPDLEAERREALRAGAARDAGGRLQRPDGDVELGAGAGADAPFAVPPCGACGGVLKPDVVFFGDNIPPERKDRAACLAASCDALLVVGSSVMVYSAFRLVEGARAAGGRLAILNVGPTRADKLADIKVEARAGEVLTRLARHPTLQLPRL